MFSSPATRAKRERKGRAKSSEKDRHYPEIPVLESCDNSKSVVRKTEVSRKGAKAQRDHWGAVLPFLCAFAPLRDQRNNVGRSEKEAKSEKDRHHPEIPVLESCDYSESVVRKTEVSRKGTKRLLLIDPSFPLRLRVINETT